MKGSSTALSKASGDVRNDYNPVDFGHGVGLRYNGGFTHLYKNKSASALHHDGFQLYVGFRLGGQ